MIRLRRFRGGSGGQACPIRDARRYGGQACLLLFLVLAPGAPAQDVPNAAEALHFEQKIRPILKDKCYSCHSAEATKLKGGLHLDSRESLLRGGDSGPALLPGDPEKSLLVRVLRWDGDEVRMPPKKKLAKEEIAELEAWVKKGANWPGDAAKASPAAKKQVGPPVEEGRKFWSYRPIASPAVPAVQDAAWPRNEIDRFILAKLEAAGFKPMPPAEKAVLLRRVSYDLLGLPPSPEEVDAFVADPAPDAYEKAVDRMLASRAFGERWGRHWLDVSRFAESLTLRGFILKEAWRYRDYVIDAFNADVPFDRFIREQIAGDLLPSAGMAERRKQLVAASFLTLGNTNLEEQDKKQLEMDVVDEQIEAVGRAFLAQTITCARCHDHKFDPIPTRDYYAIAGVFKNVRTVEHANVSKWLEMPLPVDAAREAELKKQEAAIAALQARIKTEKEKTPAGKIAAAKVKGVLQVSELPGIAVDDAKAEKVGEWKASTFSGAYIGQGYVHDDAKGKGEKSLTFHPELPAGTYEVRFAYAPGEGRATKVPVTILSAEGEKTVEVNQVEVPPIDGRFVSLGRFRFENNQGYVMVSNEGTRGHVTADAVVFLPVDAQEASKPQAKPSDATAAVKALEEELKKLQDSGPKRDMVLCVKEVDKVADLRIHVRGSVHTLGEKAPRGVLQVASAAPVAMPEKESGRRELAGWIASRENPLTARVFANRAWHWLFGAGLVRTTDNFGITGEAPSHPELLDHLASRFVEDGWSVKALVRRIVLSSTYRTASVDPVHPPETDPENRLVRGMNRRRMDAESLRDTLLTVSGTLQPDAPAGPTWPASVNADYSYRHQGLQRSVYVPVFRNALPELFEVFDFADTSVPTGRRNVSTVAPQALYLMNSPFVLEHATLAARRLKAEPLADDAARALRAWRLALGRPPSAAEAALALRHAGKGGDWTPVFHALFASVEFRYVN